MPVRGSDYLILTRPQPHHHSNNRSIQRFNFKHRLYKLREERNIRPSSFAQLVSATLYEKRFGPYFCQPVIAGLEPDGTPYLCGMDSIGAIETAKDFMVAGTASDALLGICESLWRPDMVGWCFGGDLVVWEGSRLKGCR